MVIFGTVSHFQFTIYSNPALSFMKILLQTLSLYNVLDCFFAWLELKSYLTADD